MQKLLRGLKSPSNWLAVIPVFIFFVAVITLPQNAIAILTNGLDIGGAVLLNFALLPAWVRMLRRDGPSAEAYLFGGILMIVDSIAASRLWSLAIIMSGKPAWMINHWFQSFCYLMVGVGIFYLLRIPGQSYRGGYKYIAYGAALSIVVMCLFLVYLEN